MRSVQQELNALTPLSPPLTVAQVPSVPPAVYSVLHVLQVSYIMSTFITYISILIPFESLIRRCAKKSVDPVKVDLIAHHMIYRNIQ